MSFPPNIEDDRTFADLVGDDQERGGGHIALIMMMLVMMMLVVVMMMMIRRKGKESHGSLCSAIRRQSP